MNTKLKAIESIYKEIAEEDRRLCEDFLSINLKDWDEDNSLFSCYEE